MTYGGGKNAGKILPRKQDLSKDKVINHENPFTVGEKNVYEKESPLFFLSPRRRASNKQSIQTEASGAPTPKRTGTSLCLSALCTV